MWLRYGMSLVRASLAAMLVVALPGVAFAQGPISVQSIEVKDYPTVRVTVSLPPAMAQAQPTFSVSENGVAMDDVASAKLEAEQASSTRVVLLIDTSGSMDGAPLADARAAAKRFVSQLGTGAQVAVVTFADKPEVVTGFTSDVTVLDRAIDSLDASGETALYDGLIQAAKTVASLGPEARASVVVLSDGGDTVSDASISEARDRFERINAPVYAVALKSDEYNPRALQLITESTQGRLVGAKDTQSLTQLFEGIAEEISSAYVLTYSSGRPKTADIDLDIRATAGGNDAQAAVSYKNPALSAPVSGAPVFPSVEDDSQTLVIIAVCAALAMILLVVGVMLIALRERNTLGHLKFYDQLHEEGPDSQGGTGRVREAIVDAVDVVASKRGLTSVASAKLEAAGLPLRPSEYMAMHIIAVVGLSVLAQVLVGNIGFSVLVIGATTIGPLIAIDMAADARRRRFEEQLPDMLAMVAGSLRGGWGLQQAIGLAAHESAPPAGPELKRVETETRLGMPLERSLQAMADRLGSVDFQAAVGAIAVQRDVGGNLAEVLDLVAKTIRERDAMRRQIRALTAEGRLSAWILIALPFVICAILMFTSPTYIATLFTTLPGIMMTVVGVVLLAVGSVWMYRVTKIEV